MRSVGIFEAKAKLSEICQRVADSGEGVVITRRGKPLVKIGPLSTTRFSVWEERERYIAGGGRLKEEYDPPPRSRELPASNLDD